ncbi:hypothetical protein GQ42DRAFT_172575 [Ramicandelaber brevisporus]|nr:hypothetical protein GQ42DRAFT_172575 [Ramicandelaber brevisporus]
MVEYYVLRCFDDKCGVFQVQQRTKSGKWTCKLCHQKQSIKKVYFTSTVAKDCREAAQALGMRRMEAEQQKAEDAVALLEEYELAQLGDDFDYDGFNDDYREFAEEQQYHQPQQYEQQPQQWQEEHQQQQQHQQRQYQHQQRQYQQHDGPYEESPQQPRVSKWAKFIDQSEEDAKKEDNAQTDDVDGGIRVTTTVPQKTRRKVATRADSATMSPTPLSASTPTTAAKKSSSKAKAKARPATGDYHNDDYSDDYNDDYGYNVPSEDTSYQEPEWTPPKRQLDSPIRPTSDMKRQRTIPSPRSPQITTANPPKPPSYGKWGNWMNNASNEEGKDEEDYVEWG